MSLSPPSGFRDTSAVEQYVLLHHSGINKSGLNFCDTFSSAASDSIIHAELFQHLHCVHQVSLNTAAIARHLRKVQGCKRRVARTTLTSTALTALKTMPSETSQSQSSASPAPAPSTGAQEVDVGGAGDGSFETVAEALRLQWSVIGEV